MSRYSHALTRKLEDLNGSYKSDFMAIGRLITIAGNPYGLYPGLSDQNRHEIANIIRGDKKDVDTRVNCLSYESLNVAQSFVTQLLSEKNNLSLPSFEDETQFKRIANYGELLQDLTQMRGSKSSLKRGIRDNIKMFLESRTSGFFKGKLEDKLIMRSFEPKNGPILRVSYRTKTRESFIEKALERFIRLDTEIIQKIYETQNGKIMGKEIFMDYFRRFKKSGEDIYHFWAKENPIYLSDGDLDNFKERFIAIFPIDHDGVKIIVKTRDDARYLGAEIFKNGISKFKGFPIHLKLCEDNLGHSEGCECKDGSYTLGIGARTIKSNDINKYLIQSGMTEIKIQPYENVMESEFGTTMHLTYKGEKRFELKCLLQGVNKEDITKTISINKNYVQYYSYLCRTFRVEPQLLTERIY